MSLIIQRAKNIVVDELSFANGSIAYFSPVQGSSAAYIEKMMKKLLKCRMWETWKKNLVEMGYNSVIVLENPNEVVLNIAQDIFASNYKIEKLKIILLRSSKLTYINDGPCTFILD